MSKKSDSRGRPRRTLDLRVPPARADFFSVLVSKQRAAELLSLSPRTIDNLIRGGQLESSKVGDRRLVSLAELFSFAERSREAAGATSR